MLKLILGECRNQIRYYKYIAYTFWEHFYFLSTVHNTVQVPQKIYHTPHPPLDKLPAAVWAVRICEWEHSSASKNAKMSFFSPSFVGLFPWHSSIQCFVQSLFKDSQNWVFSRFSFKTHTSLQMKISTASVSRSSRPLKGFSGNFLGAVLSTPEGIENGKYQTLYD